MLYDVTVPQFIKMLENLNRFFDKASATAEAKKFDVAVLLGSRLSPDQFPLIRQVQTACDTAKLASARLTGKDAPVNQDTEKTLEELRARIEGTVAWLRTISREDFAGAEERRISQPRWQGRSLSGAEYAVHHAIPNFYFHVTTTYAILRHNGVDLGKMDFLGALPFRDPS
jgi:uncharacterized protein